MLEQSPVNRSSGQRFWTRQQDLLLWSLSKQGMTGVHVTKMNSNLVGQAKWC